MICQHYDWRLTMFFKPLDKLILLLKKKKVSLKYLGCVWYAKTWRISKTTILCYAWCQNMACRAKVVLARNTGIDFGRSSLQAHSLLVCYGTHVFAADTQCLHLLHSGFAVLFPILSPCQLLAQESFVRIKTTVTATETIQFISCKSNSTYTNNKCHIRRN